MCWVGKLKTFSDFCYAVFFSDLIWLRNDFAYRTEKKWCVVSLIGFFFYAALDRNYDSWVLLINGNSGFISDRTFSCYNVWIDHFLIFFCQKDFLFYWLKSSLWRTFFLPAWELTSFFWNLARWQYLRFPFFFPVLTITLLPAVFGICLSVSSSAAFLMLCG